jgi:hypothetical protein
MRHKAAETWTLEHLALFAADWEAAKGHPEGRVYYLANLYGLRSRQQVYRARKAAEEAGLMPLEPRRNIRRNT